MPQFAALAGGNKSMDLPYFFELMIFELRKGASITHFVSWPVPKKYPKKILYNYMHYLMDNSYISHSYMNYFGAFVDFLGPS